MKDIKEQYNQTIGRLDAHNSEANINKIIKKLNQAYCEYANNIGSILLELESIRLNKNSSQLEQEKNILVMDKLANKIDGIISKDYYKLVRLIEDTSLIDMYKDKL